MQTSIAVVMMRLTDDQASGLLEAVRSVREASPSVEAFSAPSGTGATLWLLSSAVCAKPHADRLAGHATAALGPTPALVTATATLLSEHPAEAGGLRAAWAMLIPYEPPADEVEMLDRWYTEEHAELLLRSPSWVRIRRFAVDTVAGAAWKRLLIHDVTGEDALEAPEVVASQCTPWRCDLAARPWFLAGGRQPMRRC
jgi:hypothetical protein